MKPADVSIIGGGFFGLTLAAHCARAGCTVRVFEKNDRLMGQASYNNQARVHNGYHYPRSVLTALRSRVNFPRFIADFEEAIVRDFTKIYAVPKAMSKVTATQYRRFMERIGAPIQPARGSVRRMFSPRIAEAFECIEYAFDADKLRMLAERRAVECGVEILLNAEVMRIVADRNTVKLGFAMGGMTGETVGKLAFNCTYTGINGLLRRSNLPLLAFKHEMTEMCLVRPPAELEHFGITVMCGPFFSIMPFPPLGVHTLSHVRYTPHCSWVDRAGNSPDSADMARIFVRRSNFTPMRLDARRYLPAMDACVQCGSLWEVKTVLPRSEGDDSRPILFTVVPGLPRLINVMGGKIDNIYDALSQVDAVLHQLN